MFSNIMIKFKFAKKYNYSNKNARKVLQMLLDILNNVHRLTEYKSFDSVKTKFDEIQKEFEQFKRKAEQKEKDARSDGSFSMDALEVDFKLLGAEWSRKVFEIIEPEASN